MAPHAGKQTAPAANETEQVQRALAGDAGAFRAIMQTHNRRLYRIARSILRTNADAEDAVQEAYVSAFTKLENYRGEGTLKSWLSRIVINESLGRMRQRHSPIDLATLEQQQGEAQIIQFPQSTPNDDPERTMAQRQIIHLVEQATDNLPETFRMVFVTRVIEGMSIEETSELLGIKPETVKPIFDSVICQIADRQQQSAPRRRLGTTLSGWGSAGGGLAHGRRQCDAGGTNGETGDGTRR